MELKKDNRLYKTHSYSRLWHDGGTILVPEGESLSRPMLQEHVGENVTCTCEISKGYFKNPYVKIVNDLVQQRYFDKFHLQTWRNPVDIPIDDSYYDYHEDLGLYGIVADVDLVFSVTDATAKNGMFEGSYTGRVFFKWLNNNIWISESLVFRKYDLQALIGEFFLICNPTKEYLDRGISYKTNKFLQIKNLPVTIVLERSYIKNGNSEMELLLNNVSIKVNNISYSNLVVRGE